MKKSVFFLFVFILGLDFLTKYWTVVNLPQLRMDAPFYPYGGVGIFENIFGVEFSIVHAINLGAAWGVFSAYQYPLAFLRIILICAMTVYLLFFNHKRIYELPLTMIIAGAIGNVIDTFLYGHVIDMFHFVLWGYDYPVFNVADSFICVGIALLFVFSFLFAREQCQSLS